MRIGPISQNNQSFKAVNQKYYKRALEEVSCLENVTNDWLCSLRYDIYAKNIPVKDGIDTLLAVKNIIYRCNEGLYNDLNIYENLFNREQSKQ